MSLHNGGPMDEKTLTAVATSPMQIQINALLL
jgi:hypothetical protein